MKAIIPIILAAVLTVVAPFSGCTTATPGGIVTEEKEFTDFTNVAAEGTFEVEIVQSDLFSTTITTDADFSDYVAVAKEGSTLRIYLNPHHTFTDFTLHAKTFKAKIALPILHGIQLSGASKGTVSGFKSSQNLSLNISGASSLNIANIEVGDAEFKVSGASTVTGNINAGNIQFEVSGASKIELAGSAKSIMLTASGASKTNLDNFPLNNANVNLSGASEATLNIEGRLDAVLSDASTLYFRGNPTMGNISISGASTIKHK